MSNDRAILIKFVNHKVLTHVLLLIVLMLIVKDLSGDDLLALVCIVDLLDRDVVMELIVVLLNQRRLLSIVHHGTIQLVNVLVDQFFNHFLFLKDQSSKIDLEQRRTTFGIGQLRLHSIPNGNEAKVLNDLLINRELLIVSGLH